MREQKIVKAAMKHIGWNAKILGEKAGYDNFRSVYSALGGESMLVSTWYNLLDTLGFRVEVRSADGRLVMELTDGSAQKSGLNAVTFKGWLGKFLQQTSAVGDVAREVYKDSSFPESKSRGRILDYLRKIRASEVLIEIIEDIFPKYEKEVWTCDMDMRG